MSGWSISQAALQLSTYTQLTFSCFWTLSFLAASMAKSVLTYAIVLFCACLGFFFFSKYGIIGEGNGNPIQYSCLENPMDRGTWWAAVYGVTQSWTWLKWLSSSSSSIITYILIMRNLRLMALKITGKHVEIWKIMSYDMGIIL